MKFLPRKFYCTFLALQEVFKVAVDFVPHIQSFGATPSILSHVCNWAALSALLTLLLMIAMPSLTFSSRTKDPFSILHVLSIEGARYVYITFPKCNLVSCLIRWFIYLISFFPQCQTTTNVYPH